jgi:nicotinamide-nucleotide amidase
MRDRTAEIIAIGDELLRGIVQESNAHWLAKRLAARGARLMRTTTLPDDPAIVADEIAAALARRPTLVITHGGLGPTEDDRTRAIIARALDRPQQRDEAAEAIVRRRYLELAAAGRVSDPAATPARLRMADLPSGARALDNQVGAAPAFTIALGNTTLIALPGVPPELEWIWEHPLAPVLDELIGPGGYAELTLTLDWLDESALADGLERIAAAHPGVYVKSRARGFGDDDLVRITMHAVGANDADARALVETAHADVRGLLDRLGIALAQ